MSRFIGPQPGYKNLATGTKGILRAYKEQKRLEAEVRDELLPVDSPKRRSVRLGSLPEPQITTRRRSRKRKTSQSQVGGDNSVNIQVGSDVILTEFDEEALKNGEFAVILSPEN